MRLALQGVVVVLVVLHLPFFVQYVLLTLYKICVEYVPFSPFSSSSAHDGLYINLQMKYNCITL